MIPFLAEAEQAELRKLEESLEEADALPAHERAAPDVVVQGEPRVKLGRVAVAVDIGGVHRLVAREQTFVAGLHFHCRWGKKRGEK